MIFSLYILGVVLGILSGLLFKRTMFTGEEAPFVIELPPYRMPSAKNVLTHVWERVSHFLEKAGTIIFAMSVLLWFLESFNFSFQMVENAGDSIIGRIGSLIAPVFTPLGFGTWQAAVALSPAFSTIWNEKLELSRNQSSTLMAKIIDVYKRQLLRSREWN